jgi:hypothetical protein
VFQVKSVRFGRGQSRSVRDIYQMPLGSLPMSGRSPKQPAIKAFNYIFSTGATWKGNIGQTEMLVTFAPDATLPRGPVHLIAPVTGERRDYQAWIKRRNAVEVSPQAGFRANQRRLYLVKRNWKPTKADDVQLVFAPHQRG